MTDDTKRVYKASDIELIVGDKVLKPFESALDIRHEPKAVALNPAFETPPWTSFDAAVSESLPDLLKRYGPNSAIDFFVAKAPFMSDMGFWEVLSALWNSYPEPSRCDVWAKLFMTPRAWREPGLMYEEEAEALHGSERLIIAYRPQTRVGGLNPFIFCADAKTAIAHAATFGSDIIGTYTFPREDAIAYFRRRRGPEYLVVDCRNVLMTAAVPVTFFS
jgi:hypothetical protein